MKLKVKNILKSNKTIKLYDGTSYVLKVNDEKVIGNYSDYKREEIFKLLKTGFEVSKIEDEYVKDYMLIENDAKMSSKDDSLDIKEINNIDENKPKKRRGRPPKNKSE